LEAIVSYFEEVMAKIYDVASGTYKGLTFNAEAPQVCAQDYLQAIGEGDVAGHSLFSKLGYLGTATTTEQDIFPYGGTYVFPATATDVSVVSSNDNDGKTGGAACTGVRIITIHYLDGSYVEKSVDVTLNGTTAVNTTTGDIFRVNGFAVKSFGSGTTTYKAIGNIDVHKVGTATEVYSRIAVGNTRCRCSAYTVPNGKTLYVTSLSVGVTKTAVPGSSGVFTLRATWDATSSTALTAGKFFMPYAEINHVDGYTVRNLEVPIKFPAHTDIKVSALCGQIATVCTASYRGWLE
jgi:hypothetical protein